ncbi:MAG: glutathione S-transferase [Porticoccaceae bacterium]|nr:glutathione S-transferase [Porticoccaceae bacterium]
MITLYHLAVSQSDRIVWLLEELNLPYQLEWFDRGEDGLAPKEFLALHPAATSPIIRDGDVLLAESTAICEYICNRHGKGALIVKPEAANYPDYLYWLQFNNNVLSAYFVIAALRAQEGDTKDNLIAKVAARRSESYYQYINQRLGQCAYLAGDEFTCADIMSVFNLTTLPLFGGRTIEDLPNVLSYVERISQRPAYIKAMKIAGSQAQRPE